MTSLDSTVDIDIRRIRITSSAGGFGLLAVAGAMTWFLPELRWLGIAALVGGALLGLTLLAVRHPGARRFAVGALLVLPAALLIVALYYVFTFHRPVP